MLKTILKQKTKKTDGQNPRTNGKSKAIETKSHKEGYTYILIKKRKMDKEVVVLMYNGISLSHEINVIRLVAAR